MMVACSDGTLYVWQMETGKKSILILWHPDFITPKHLVIVLIDCHNILIFVKKRTPKSTEKINGEKKVSKKRFSLMSQSPQNLSLNGYD